MAVLILISQTAISYCRILLYIFFVTISYGLCDIFGIY
ncbi:hypothetical protein HMPREF1043_1331 [Streptococcus anginosus subsp. whileyi CCUG 39159]|uniref:Uncharacterized protein n=1 Tax=Streptococcus anginosus subsp. whileyi CCUG 39159 TaxID=1095729 RepID=I0SDZ5_STRAP|nr:hypothetical protein HMPREF1043_1331 [Streptococcus anginosus subsp. whileyi CCUG 39159]